MTDSVLYRGTYKDVYTAIDNDHPVVIHGYFTRSGHIVVIRGYDDRGFYVNDPYGEYFADGYDTNKRGENLHYSNQLIAMTCSPESQAKPSHLLIHILSRGKK